MEMETMKPRLSEFNTDALRLDNDVVVRQAYVLGSSMHTIRPVLAGKVPVF